MRHSALSGTISRMSSNTPIYDAVVAEFNKLNLTIPDPSPDPPKKPIRRPRRKKTPA